MATLSQKDKVEMWDRYHILSNREEMLRDVQSDYLAIYPIYKEKYQKARRLWIETLKKLRIYERLLSGKLINEYH